MKPEICAECGYPESVHPLMEIERDIVCKKFKPSQGGMTSQGGITQEEHQEEPKNHSPQGRKVGSATVSPAELKDKEPSGLKGGSDNHGSDDELKGNVTDNDKGYSKDEESLSDEKCYDAEGKFWYYKPEDIAKRVKKLKDDDEDIIEEVLHTEMPSNLSGIEITKWIISKTIELKNKKSDRIFGYKLTGKPVDLSGSGRN